MKARFTGCVRWPPDCDCNEVETDTLNFVSAGSEEGFIIAVLSFFSKDISKGMEAPASVEKS